MLCINWCTCCRKIDVGYRSFLKITGVAVARRANKMGTKLGNGYRISIDVLLVLHITIDHRHTMIRIGIVGETISIDSSYYAPLSVRILRVSGVCLLACLTSPNQAPLQPIDGRTVARTIVRDDPIARGTAARLINHRARPSIGR